MAAHRVIAVRPDPSLLDAIGRVLDPLACAPEPCAGSADALRRIREQPADVLITDATSPIDEDLALVAELARVRPALRTIVLAPSAAHAELVAAVRAQVFACFTSPFDPGEVADMVATALRAETWRDSIEVLSGTDHWLTFRVSCQALTRIAWCAS